MFSHQSSSLKTLQVTPVGRKQPSLWSCHSCRRVYGRTALAKLSINFFTTSNWRINCPVEILPLLPVDVAEFGSSCGKLWVGSVLLLTLRWSCCSSTCLQPRDHRDRFPTAAGKGQFPVTLGNWKLLLMLVHSKSPVTAVLGYALLFAKAHCLNSG